MFSSDNVEQKQAEDEVADRLARLEARVSGIEAQLPGGARADPREAGSDGA